MKWRPPLDDGGCPIKEYNVELLDPKTKKWKKIGRCKPETDPLKFPVEDLTEGEEYKFRVNSVNDEGESDWLESEKPIKVSNSKQYMFGFQQFFCHNRNQNKVD